MADAANYIDLDQFPIHQPDTAAYSALLTRTRTALEADGCAVLKGFVDQPHVRALPPHRAGPLLLAARQFDDGLTQYERALTSKDTPASSLRSPPSPLASRSAPSPAAWVAPSTRW